FPTELSRQHIEHLAGDPQRFEIEFPGLGAVADLDTTDGLRMTLSNAEIVHLRPSGNAPELRCYTEADSAERAALLNAECLALINSWRQ
ncbi:MAG: phosphomannomutase, partial [Sedimenticolaceae bacterium]